MSKVATPPRRRWLWAVPAVVILAAAAGWYGWRWATTPAPPIIPLDGLDPDVAAAIRSKLDKVRQDGRSAAAWGELGQTLLAHDEVDHADPCFAQAERFAPNEPRWPYYRGLIRRAENPEAALPFLRRAVELCDQYDHGNDAPRLTLAETLRQAGADAEAEDQLKRVLARDLANPRAHFDLGVLARERKDDGAAEKHFLAAAKSPSGRQKSYQALAAIHHEQGNGAEAEADERRAAAPPADDLWDDRYIADYEQMEVGRRGRFAQAEQLEGANRLADALPILLELAKDAADARAQIEAGKVLMRLGKLDDAERYFRAAVGKASQQAEANNFLAFALYTEGEQQERSGGDGRAKYEEALACSRKALQLKPDHVTAFQYQGLALLKLGQRREAIESMRQAVLLRPELVELHMTLAGALEADGRRGEAVKEYRRAMEVAPDDPKPRAALQRLGAAPG
ncbi:MAG TPA: tetratricopeptide repeat protein [Gemmataceae bacterium]|nr:tetratricopeptide repeat protein [Gemmataceae bacterium]